MVVVVAVVVVVDFHALSLCIVLCVPSKASENLENLSVLSSFVTEVATLSKQLLLLVSILLVHLSLLIYASFYRSVYVLYLQISILNNLEKAMRG